MLLSRRFTQHSAKLLPLHCSVSYFALLQDKSSSVVLNRTKIPAYLSWGSWSGQDIDYFFFDPTCLLWHFKVNKVSGTAITFFLCSWTWSAFNPRFILWCLIFQPARLPLYCGPAIFSSKKSKSFFFFIFQRKVSKYFSFHFQVYLKNSIFNFFFHFKKYPIFSTIFPSFCCRFLKIESFSCFCIFCSTVWKLVVIIAFLSTLCSAVKQVAGKYFNIVVFNTVF